MSKKLLKILQLIGKDLKEIEFYSDEIFDTISDEEPDLVDIGEELSVIETSGKLNDEELDILKSLLVYLLIRKSPMEKEDIYSFVFGEGRRILWN